MSIRLNLCKNVMKVRTLYRISSIHRTQPVAHMYLLEWVGTRAPTPPHGDPTKVMTHDLVHHNPFLRAIDRNAKIHRGFS